MSANPVLEAAVEYFASRSHDAWRRRFLTANPRQKGVPRLRLRGNAMVDVNQPWTKLDPKAKTDNKRAAYDAYEAIVRYPEDREKAAAFVHRRWIMRNKRDPNQPKALFKPYRDLPDVEKDKDRAHVDSMQAALAAVRKRVKRKALKRAKPKPTLSKQVAATAPGVKKKRVKKSAKKKPLKMAGSKQGRAKQAAAKTRAAKKSPARSKQRSPSGPIALDAAAARRLEAVAKQLSQKLGRRVSARDLLRAGMDAMMSIYEAAGLDTR